MYGYQALKPRSAAFKVTAGDPTLTLHQDFTQSSLANAAVVGPTLTFTRATSATYFDSNGVLQTAASGAARVAAHVYNGSSWVNKGILIEEARTNVQVNSEAFDDAAWTKTNLTVNADDIAAPDGNTTADRVTDNATSGVHYLFDAYTISASTTYTLSIFAKAGTHNYITLGLAGDERFGSAVFDISSGSTETSATETDVGTTEGAVASTTQTNVGDGWFRVSVTVTGLSGSVSTYFVAGLAEAATGNTFNNFGGSSYSGSSETAYFWGAQLEAGAFPTSYIATTTASVTRNADVLSTTTVDWFDNSKGTWNQEFSVGDQIEGTHYMFEMDDGGTTDRQLCIIAPASSDVLQFQTITSGAQATVLQQHTGVLNNDYKHAIRFTTDNTRSCLNGTLITADTDCDFPLEDSLTRLLIGSLNGSFNSNYYLKTFKYYNVAHDDATLQSETS